MIQANKQKIRQHYCCVNCDYQAAKWLGCCPECKNWNTFELQQAESFKKNSSAKTSNLKELPNIDSYQVERIRSNIKEFDRVLGGGIVPGSFIIFTGDPGIGKSTLLLQVSDKLAQNNKVLYFSSEESLQQIKVRADRLGCKSNLLCADESDLDNIIATLEAEKPDIAIIDSIQNCFTKDINTAPGSVAQLKDSAFKLMHVAKKNSIALLVSGHITKEGIIAGPKTLEHMVDAVFYLQGEDRWQTRLLRSVKNRFGTIAELGFFQMVSNGLEEMPNINQQLLQELTHKPGASLISFIEGSRPLLIELQALVLSSKYGMPQRVISGIDQTQVVLIAAILEKYLKIKLSGQDIFFKISGGFKVKTSGADLGIALALLSSYFQKPLPEKSLALGEVSLTGQIKPINHAMLHISEAEKFGINNFLVAKNQKIQSKSLITNFNNVYDLLMLFE